jgi:hypothetical protein
VFVKAAEKQKFLYNRPLEEVTKEAIENFIKGVEGKKIKGVKLDTETRSTGATKTPGAAKTTDEL